MAQKRFGPLKKINKKNLSNLPDTPGVYGIFTNSGNLQYVGEAKRHRLDERILESAGNVGKANRQASKFGFIKTKTVGEAIKLETKLIKERKPPLNKEMKGK